MTEVRKTYAGVLKLNGKKRRIWISDGKGIQKEGRDIIFGMGTADERWLRELMSFAHKKDDVFFCDHQMSRYFLLYVLYSMKERVCLRDLLYIYSLEEICRECTGQPPVVYYRNVLEQYMNDHDFVYHIIGIPCWPIGRYGSEDLWSSKGIKLIVTRVVENISLYYRGLRSFFGGFSRIADISGLFGNEKIATERMKSGDSGCLLFKLKTGSGKEYFIKCSTAFSDSLLPEYNAAERIGERECFILPMLKHSSSEVLVFPYMEERTLDEVCKERSLDTEETRLFYKFLISCLDALSESAVVHRDIRPQNITVTEDTKGIKAFHLIDFGCAVIDGCVPVGRKEKRKNRMCGSIYRYAEGCCDDAFSALQLFMCYADRNCPQYRIYLSNLRVRCGKDKISI